MGRNSLLKVDLKKLNNLKSQLPKGASEALDKFQSQLVTYEERVRGIAQTLDAKQEKVRRDVERIGKRRLTQLATDLRKTRTTVEKKVINLVGEKRKDLQTRVNEMVIYLTGLAGKDVLRGKKKSTSRTKKSTKKTSTGRKSKAKRMMGSNGTIQNPKTVPAESLSV